MKGIIFGPAASRRLGRSLGISIVPKKVCSLDCLYCEVSKTTVCTLKRAPYVPAREVLAEFKAKYPVVRENTDVVTITGLGEPTLNSQLKEIIAGIKEVSEHPVALLTNSTTLADKEVVQALLPLDIIVPSLDAVSQDIFESVDKPITGLRITEIIESLVSFSHKFGGRLYLEALLVKGVNDSRDELVKFAETAKRIRHDKVQIGTVFRPPAGEGVKSLSKDELEEARLILEGRGLNAEITGLFSADSAAKAASLTVKEYVEALLLARPVTISDIATGTGISEEDAKRLIALIDSVQVRNYNGEVYYSRTTLLS